ncbi:unnamed protein product [Penicillium nalgiovense]|nr:unnamed protein product [Penicillium nalgiovense]
MVGTCVCSLSVHTIPAPDTPTFCGALRVAITSKEYTPSEIIGKHFSVFYSPEDYDRDKPGRGLRLALQNGRIEDEGWRLVATLALSRSRVTSRNGRRRRLQLEYLSIIEDSTSVLLQIINDVLVYSKLSSGSFSLCSNVVDIKSILEAAIRNCRPLLKPGFADSGFGISECAINTLFTPFTRFADSEAQKYQGTGLGLSICKSLAELMDGTVGYRPGPEGKGSVFWFTAKMGCADMRYTKEKPIMPPTDDTRDLLSKVREIAPRKHILFVEDNLVNHMVMLKLLQSLNFERIDVAWDGAEAVRHVKQMLLSYNMVLMDISMPVLDGLEATSQIRATGVDMPIIALTANALKGDMETYIAKGMNDYIAKPVHRDKLLQVLWKWMGA